MIRSIKDFLSVATSPPKTIDSSLETMNNAGISFERALRGRDEKMAGISGLRHYVLKTDLKEVPPGHEVAVFGNGCFWGSEKAMWRLPRGVHSTAVGYCAGYTRNPTYEEACSGMTGHTEGVRVVYNPREVSFVDILRPGVAVPLRHILLQRRSEAVDRVLEGGVREGFGE
jgi:hypothetical protein